MNLRVYEMTGFQIVALGTGFTSWQFTKWQFMNWRSVGDFLFQTSGRAGANFEI